MNSSNKRSVATANASSQHFTGDFWSLQSTLVKLIFTAFGSHALIMEQIDTEADKYDCCVLTICMQKVPGLILGISSLLTGGR